MNDSMTAHTCRADSAAGRDMLGLSHLPDDELAGFAAKQHSQYDDAKAAGFTLDLTRGKPSAAQLDLSDELRRLPIGFQDAGGGDTRNYGGLQGLPELRAIFGELLGVDPRQVVAGGNSSLSMMRDALNYLMLHGGPDSDRPWVREERVRFICPVPGYELHYKLLDALGIEMLAVPMREDGPDSEAVARLVADDPTIKGIWVVPTYANPTGATCSDAVALRLASMKAAAPDFTIMWDNAYVVHHLTDLETRSADILSFAAEAGHPNRPIVFASTSKITFAGAGVAFVAASPAVTAWYLGHLGAGYIGPDKLNQLRHAEFFADAAGVREHMRKHRAIIAPKFAAVDRVLTEELDGLNVARWTRPAGGYFVSVSVVPGTASRVVQLAREAGVALTPAGSTFPSGKDPLDTNIRIAPTFPPLGDVTQAMRIAAVSVRLAAAEHEIARRHGAGHC